MFEIDTGSAVTLVNERALRQVLALLPPAPFLRSFMGQCVNVRGLYTAEVEHRGKLHYHPIHTVRTNCQPNLLGRKWISLLPDLVSYIRRVEENPALACVLQKHHEQRPPRHDSSLKPLASQISSDHVKSHTLCPEGGRRITPSTEIRHHRECP